MLSALRALLLFCLIPAAMPAWGGENLPTLPSSGSAGLPTLGSSSMNTASMPDQTLSVTCYLGNPNDKQSLGSITVNSPAAAGPNCNSLNYACNGRCFGCYSDFDLSEDICVDSAGRRFMR